MGGISGFTTQSKKSRNEFLTVQNLGGGRYGLDVIQRVAYKTSAVANTVASVDAVKPKSIIHVVNHGLDLEKGDFVRIDSEEYPVLRVIDADTFELASEMPQNPAIGAEVFIMRPISLTVDKNGQLITSQGPLQYVRDAVATEVREDTADVSNNKSLPIVPMFYTDGNQTPVNKDNVDANNTRGLPVEIVGADGTAINITAGDINVQLSHDGANPDSTQIGDGTNLLGINASNEAKVNDADANLKLDAIKTSVELLDNTVNANDQLNVKLDDLNGAATDAKLDTILTELTQKTEPADNQNVVVTSSVLPSGASTALKQDSVIAKLTDIFNDLDGKADKNETQPVSLASQPLPTGASTEAKQDSTITKLNDLLTELQLKADLTETQPVSLASTPLPTDASTETKQDTIITKLDALLGEDQIQVVGSDYIDTSATAIPGNGLSPLEVTASSPNIRQIQSLDTTGAYIGLYIGASGSETLKYIIGPGSDTTIKANIPSGTRISVRNMDSSNIVSGNLALNYIG